MNNTIQYTLDDDGIATLLIDLQGSKMNILNQQVLADLSACIDKVTADDEVKGAIVASAKPTFVVGADLMELVTAYDRGMTAQQGYAWSQSLTRLLRRMETCGKPFAAAINGLALGGGLELCLACHYRVLTDDAAARLGLPEVGIGLIPGAGGTQRLPRLTGIEKSLPVILQGGKLAPDEALALGVVHELAPAAAVLDRARQWLLASPCAVAPWDAKGFSVPGGAGASNPKTTQAFMLGTALLAGKTRHNYPAPIAALSAVYEGCITPFDTGLDIESQYFGRLLSGVTARNIMRSLFVNKGAADKLQRRPPGVEKSRVGKLAVLGAGMMGAGIACVSARAGVNVVLLDVTPERAEHGKAHAATVLEEAVKRGQMERQRSQAILDLITPTADYLDLAGADLVIEAVFEDRETKAEVTAKAEAVIPRHAIFASNTSTLPITRLAEASRRPESFIGLHFFSPVEKMPLVELITGEKSSSESVARGLDYIQQLRKTPIVVNDSRGFYTSRVFGTYTDEGMTMLAEGVLPALVENAARLAGMPVGPLAVMDEVTLELGYRIGLQAAREEGEGHDFATGFTVLRKFVEDLGRKGKRYGAGFYDYPGKGEKRLWPGLAEIYPPLEEQPAAAEVIKRLLYRQALETARCFEEGVLAEPADADIGSIFGWGFPAWTGGTLSLIDTLGAERFVAECDRLAAAYGPRFAVPDGLRQRAREGRAFYPPTG
ncbi:MAG: 3-hydroxyacyl-CoA dehydrogenase NAD-binding domain-containing protein [Lysobacterales bacterium]|jgi:3-hydroxyacyl-CoA dehydrogenase/enoyl-CoA hydratase/3-hydroxybutyryl-CoA epimerase